MATNLSPELMAQLQAYFALPQGTQQDINENPGMYRGAYYFDPATGMTYMQGGGNGMDAPLINGQSQTYSGYDFTPGSSSSKLDLNGSPYDVYGSNGDYLRTNTFDLDGDPLIRSDAVPLAMMALPFAATALGVAGAGGAGAGAAGAAEGSSLAAGSGLTGSTGASLTGGMGTFAPAGAGYVGSGALIPELGMGSALTYGGGALGLDAALSGLGATGAAGALGAGAAAAAASGAASSVPGWLGPAAALAGAAAGAQGQNKSETQQIKMDPRMDPYIYGSLLPQVNGLLASQMPLAQQNAQALQSAGRGLLSTSLTPNFASNPYMTGVADDLQKRTADLLAQNNLNIQGNAVATGGMGGSRMGVQQGIAAGKAADYLQGNLANLYQSQYNTDASRALQAQTLGAGLLTQGQQTAWQPLSSASDLFKPYTGLNSSQTTSNQAGGGWQGGVGGALTGAAFGHSMGWW
jgi:hypothetical protein